MKKIIYFPAEMAIFPMKVVIAMLLFLQVAFSQDNLRTLSNVEEIANMVQMMNVLSVNKKVVSAFYVNWSPTWKAMSLFIDNLAVNNPSIKFVRVNAAVVNDVVEWGHFTFIQTPMFKIFFNGQNIGNIDGPNLPELSNLVKELNLKTE